MRIGATFSATQARWLGLDPQAVLADTIALGLDPLRLCGYWNQPLDDLEWQLDQVAAAGREVLLTVGMKAPRWPEFHIPEARTPDVRDGHEIHPTLPIAAAVLEQVATTVERFRDQPAISWWQVENEPLNRSGPQRWWITPQLVDAEIAIVRARDDRPIALTAFGHFDRIVDEQSGHTLVNEAALLGHGSGVEPDLLKLLQPGDILGLDLYHTMGNRIGPTSHAASPDRYLAHWLEQTRSAGVDCWLTELQAEPWEATNQTLWNPRTVKPDDLMPRLQAATAAGVETVLLWGVEYWLAQADRGDHTWVTAARDALRAPDADDWPQLEGG